MLSASASASGANLQCANHIILLDPPGHNAAHGAALERQAIARSVRIGQERRVTVTRFVVQDTIEEALTRQNALAAKQEAEAAMFEQTYTCDVVEAGPAHQPKRRAPSAPGDGSNGASAPGSGSGSASSSQEAPRAPKAARRSSGGALAKAFAPKAPKAREVPKAEELAMLLGMGFGRTDCETALSCCDNDVGRAIDMICAGNLPITIE